MKDLFASVPRASLSLYTVFWHRCCRRKSWRDLSRKPLLTEVHMLRECAGLAVLLVVLGCDTTPPTVMNSDPRPSLGSTMPKEPNGFIRYEDMDPAEARRMRDAVARAAAARETDAHSRRRALHEQHPVRYALSEEPLPEGTVALVVHDARSQWPRTIVLSPLADDRALALADAALAHAEEHAPVVHDRRVLRVTSGGEVSSHTGEPDLRFTLDLRFASSAGTVVVGSFLRAAERGRVIHIQGFGRARTVEP